MIKHEANFGLIFRSWFKKRHKQFESCTFEHKDTRGKKSFALSEWKQAQRDHAEACTSDRGNLLRFQSGTVGMPDYGYYRNAYAYVVIKYPKAFYIINAMDLLKHKSRSLSEADADCLAIHSVPLSP